MGSHDSASPTSKTTRGLQIISDKMACKSVVLVFLACFSLSSAQFRWNGGGLRAPPLTSNAKPPEAQWFDQSVDHFGGLMLTWKQRYFVNSTYWSAEDGPVFLMLGGEGPANPTWIFEQTDIMKNAQKYKAMVILLEHRYYGESRPTQSLSNTDLHYLSSRQALADVVTFKPIIVSKYKMTSKNKWISFGGSYSGALSAWLRIVHPDVVVGAVATSAPVLAQFNFKRYMEVATRSLKSTAKGQECVGAIQSATTKLNAMLVNQSNWNFLEFAFNISPPIEDVLDVSQVAQNLAGNFMGVVQYNRDNTAFEGRPNNITIDDLCTIMTNKSLGGPLTRYAAVNSFMMKNESLDCSFKNMIQELSNTSWKSPASEGGRQWTYQTCTEFGYYQTSDSGNQVFGDLIPLASFTEVCRLAFGVSIAETVKAIKETNSYYGGLNINGTNIVFPNGSIDPWHALSITPYTTTKLDGSVQYFFVQGTAHCANMYPSRSSDLQELNEAREKISMAIGSWLKS